MITTFIFTHDGIGFQYGMGKYIACFKEGISQRDDVTLNVVVFGTKDYPEMTIISEKNNINLVYFPMYFTNHLEEQHFENAEKIVFSLERFFKPDKRAIFHFVSWSGIFVAQVLKKRYDNPVIFDLHSLEWQFALNGNKKKFDDYWNQVIKDSETNDKNLVKPGVIYEKQLCDLSDHIIVRTSRMKEDVIETYKPLPDKVSIICNGITTLKTFYWATKEDVKVKLGFRSDEKIILFVGRLCDQKGIQFLIRAFRMILDEFSNVRLVIAGNGYYDTYLKECESMWGKVTFTGVLDNTSLNELYGAADIGVVPSLYEPFGYVILEMMQHFIPVISTRIEGPNEIIEDSCNGYKVNVIENSEGERSISHEELVEKIKMLLGDDDLSRSLAQNASLMLNGRFSSHEMANNIMNVYNTLLETDIEQAGNGVKTYK